MEVAPPYVSMNAGRSIPVCLHQSREQPRSRDMAGNVAAVAAGTAQQLWSGGAWGSSFEQLPPILREALLPCARVAWAARLSVTGTDEDGDEAGEIERGGREEALHLAVKGLDEHLSSLDDCGGILGLLDALCLACSLTALHRAACGEQWRWVSCLTSVRCVSEADIGSAEIGINELAVRDKLGGGDLLRRAVAVGLLGQLGCRLKEGGGQTTTQLNIMCKNIAGVLQGLSYPTEGEGEDEEGATSMCRVCAVGTLATVASRWAPSGGGGGRDPSFLLLSTRVLFAFIHTLPRGPTDAGRWCRWTAAHGLASLFRAPEVWRVLSKKSQADSLRQILLALEAKGMDDICRVFVIRMIDNIVAYSFVANLPNYLSQLLSRLLALLPSVADDGGEGLVELRWAALGFVARFLADNSDAACEDLAFKLGGGAWAGACSSEQQVTALKADVRRAFQRYCERNSLQSADVRLPA